MRRGTPLENGEVILGLLILNSLPGNNVQLILTLSPIVRKWITLNSSTDFDNKCSVTWYLAWLFRNHSQLIVRLMNSAMTSRRAHLSKNYSRIV